MAQEEWNYKQEGLTPAAAAFIAIAVTIATNGAGASILGTTGATTSAVVNAAFSSLVSQASVTLINNKGNVTKTLKDMGKSDTAKNIAQAAITAGVTASLDSLLSTTFNIDTSAEATLKEQFIRSFVQGTGHALTDSLLYGTSLEDNLKQQLTNQLTDAAAAGVYRHGVKAIDTNDTEFISNVAHKLAAGLTGCVSAKAKDQSCEAAAVGAIIGEMVGDWMIDDEIQAKINKRQILPGSKEYNKILNTAKLTAGSVALLYDFDVDTAVGSAGVAVENNALQNFHFGIWGKDQLEQFKQEYQSTCSKYPLSTQCQRLLNGWKNISYKNAKMTPADIQEWESAIEKIYNKYYPRCANDVCRTLVINAKQYHLVANAESNTLPLVQLEAGLETYFQGVLGSADEAGVYLWQGVLGASEALAKGKSSGPKVGAQTSSSTASNGRRGDTHPKLNINRTPRFEGISQTTLHRIDKVLETSRNTSTGNGVPNYT
ncbi:DUF637 domain-containing protein [Moraxella marmotae]|uniref:DUF637 domain-containing protein n=1 Tax=Moraxella marmotae TaxID=3344520 RepID=UPI0035F4CE91